MLVVVVTLFLLVEFPLGVSMSVMIVENTANTALVDEQTRALLDLFLNLVILTSYPLNFFATDTCSPPLADGRICVSEMIQFCVE